MGLHTTYTESMGRVDLLTPPPPPPPVELYMVTVPALLGMARALQGCHVIQRQAFWDMCQPHQDPWSTEEHPGWGMMREQAEQEESYNMALFEVVSVGHLHMSLWAQRLCPE